MANILQIKTDVSNELRNEIYYSQQEIQRLMNNSVELPYKEVVTKVAALFKEIVTATEAINLIERSFTPAQQPAPSSAEQAPQPTAEEALGVKKVD